MRFTKHDKKYLLNFLMQSNSLHDLLEILANICENLNLNYLNPRIKHFKYFQFTFFGLMVRAKGLLDMMTFRAEFLKNNLDEFNKIYLSLIKLKKKNDLAYNLVNKKKMFEGKNEIIKLNKEYSETFDDILKTCAGMI